MRRFTIASVRDTESRGLQLPSFPFLFSTYLAPGVLRARARASAMAKLRPDSFWLRVLRVGRAAVHTADVRDDLA